MESSYTIIWSCLRPRARTVCNHVSISLPHAHDLHSVEESEILAFVDAGGNVLLAADSIVSDKIREIARGVGAELAESYTSVIDHHSFDESDADGHHSTIIADHFIENTRILSLLITTGLRARSCSAPSHVCRFSLTLTIYCDTQDRTCLVPRHRSRRPRRLSQLPHSHRLRLLLLFAH